MKKYALLLLLLLLLGGCGTRSEETVPATAEPVPTAAPPETEEGLIRSTEPEGEEEPAPPAPGQHQAAYSILENDDSIRNAGGDILVNIRYDQVILDTAQARWEGINALILEDYRDFLGETAYLHDTPPQDWEEQILSMGYLYGNLLVNCTAEVTNNSGGIFSIRMTQDFFLGGVFNSDHYGLNFNLNTGEALTLAQLSELPEAEFAAQLKAIVCAELAEDVDVLFQDPAEVLAGYALEDFEFYLEEGQLVLTFPTYTFGPGAMGGTTIKTGIYPQI